MQISKSLALLFVILMAGSLFGVTILDDWFDYRNCDFCKQWGADPRLIAHTQDECKNLTDGILWITHIDKGYEDRFAKVVAAEGKVGEELTAGKPLKLCQYCNQIAQFSAANVRIESVEGTNVFVTLYTSTDTIQVRKLHEFAARAIAEETKANAAFLESEHKSENK